MFYSIILSCLLAVTPSQPGIAYNGVWVTGGERKRALNGDMACIVKEVSPGNYTGHFYGTWNGVNFSYFVKFTGTLDKLTGVANIDNNDYTWTGSIQKNRFVGEFRSPRYDGYFDLRK